MMWIISKSHREKNFFFDIFAIHSSSRYEKCCQISVRLFSLFRGSIYQQCKANADTQVHSSQFGHKTQCDAPGAKHNVFPSFLENSRPKSRRPTDLPDFLVY